MGLDDEARSHIAALEGTVAACRHEVDDIVERLCACFRGGGKLLVCGNGGSAADAQHVAAEFVNRLHFERSPLPALALTTDSSVLTSVANDRAYAEVFSRQVQALGSDRDALLALSTSGSSPSVLAALAAARGRRMYTVGLTGRTGVLHMAPHCDTIVSVASDECTRIQECHEFVAHVIAGAVERELFGPSPDRSSLALPGS